MINILEKEIEKCKLRRDSVKQIKDNEMFLDGKIAGIEFALQTFKNSLQNLADEAKYNDDLDRLSIINEICNHFA